MPEWICWRLLLLLGWSCVGAMLDPPVPVSALNQAVAGCAGISGLFPSCTGAAQRMWGFTSSGAALLLAGLCFCSRCPDELSMLLLQRLPSACTGS